MPNVLVNLWLSVALMTTPAACPPQGGCLSVGDPAPPLAVSKWVQGEPVRSFEPGTLYVVAFWATWSGPCRDSLAQLTMLQKTHTDVVFIGVDIWEDDVSLVLGFLEELGEPIGYRVALDAVPANVPPGQGTMARTWMKAAGQDGIPTVFLIGRDGRIAWIGHPARMARVLDALVAGELDVASAAEAARAEAARQAKLQALTARLEQMGGPREAVQAGLLAEVEALMAGDPELARRLADLRFILLLASNEPAAAAYAEQLASDAAHRNDAAALNILAWSLIDPRARPTPGEAARKVALKIAKRAVEKSEKGQMSARLDTLAWAQFLNGDQSAAVATQERALQLAREEARKPGTDIDPELERHLKQYRAAIGLPGPTKSP